MSQIGANIGANKVNVTPTFKVTLVVGGSDVSNIPLKGYRGNTATHALPAGVTLSSDIGNSASTLDYLMNVPLRIIKTTIQTDNVANFMQKLTVGQFLPPFTALQKKNIELTKYRVSNGNGFSDVINIEDEPMITTANWSIEISKLVANSTTNIYFTIDQVGAGAMVNANEL